MAFTVETGTGLSTANSYLSVADFKAYHDDRGNDYSASSDTEIEQALVKSSDYIDTRYVFIGVRLNASQSMEWPRSNAYYLDGRPASGVPAEVQEATAEYAFRALTATLAPDPVYDASGFMLESSSDEVGPIKTSRTYSSNQTPVLFPVYPAVDNRLRELIVNGKRLLRA